MILMVQPDPRRCPFTVSVCPLAPVLPFSGGHPHVTWAHSAHMHRKLEVPGKFYPPGNLQTVVRSCMKTQLPYFELGHLWGFTYIPVSLQHEAKVNLCRTLPEMTSSLDSLPVPVWFPPPLPISPHKFPANESSPQGLLLGIWPETCFLASILCHLCSVRTPSQSSVIQKAEFKQPKINTTWSLNVGSPWLPGDYKDLSWQLLKQEEASWRVEGVRPLPGRQTSYSPSSWWKELSLNCHWGLR